MLSASSLPCIDLFDALDIGPNEVYRFASFIVWLQHQPDFLDKYRLLKLMRASVWIKHC